MFTKLKLSQFFVERDIYGHQIGVNYRGSDKYNTCLGALCTVTTYVFAMVNLYTLALAFTNGS